MKDKIYPAIPYEHHGKTFRVILLNDNAYFDKLDLEKLVGMNLYCETRYMSYKTCYYTSITPAPFYGAYYPRSYTPFYPNKEPITSDMCSLDKLPFLSFSADSLALYKIHSFFSLYFYPGLKMNIIKKTLLRTYLALFGRR